MLRPSRFASPAIPIQRNPSETRVRCPSRSAAQAQQVLQIRLPACRIQRSEHWGRISVELVDQDSVMASLHRHPSTQLPSRRPARSKRWASELDELGPVAIVPLCSRRPGRGRAAHPKNRFWAPGTANWSGAARKIQDLIKRPRGSRHGTGASSQSAKRPEESRSPAPEPLK